MADKAIYCRVSSYDQDCSAQLDGLAELMPRWNFPVYSVYHEKLSGKEGMHRPELERLMEDCRLGKVDTIMVWKMDRFGRSTLDTLTNIKALDKYGVRFICPSMSIDTDKRSPTAQFMLTIFAAVAELERNFILERTLGGYRAYKKAFESGPNAFRLFLSRRTNPHSKSGKDLPVGRPLKHVDVRYPRIVELAKLGMPKRQIAREMGIPEATVRLAIKRQA
jgi:DNA invertase Pin-like site-specific DNA recombinase